MKIILLWMPEKSQDSKKLLEMLNILSLVLASGQPEVS
jgi:hypothetical protein